MGERELAEARGPRGLRFELPGPHMCSSRRAGFHQHVRRLVPLCCVSVRSSQWPFFFFSSELNSVQLVLVEPEVYSTSDPLA